MTKLILATIAACICGGLAATALHSIVYQQEKPCAGIAQKLSPAGGGLFICHNCWWQEKGISIIGNFCPSCPSHVLETDRTADLQAVADSIRQNWQLTQSEIR